VTLIIDGIGGLAMAVAVVFLARLAYDVLRMVGVSLLLSRAKGRIGFKGGKSEASVRDRIRKYRSERDTS